MKQQKWYNNFFTEKNIIILLGIILGITTIVDLYTAYTSPIFEVAETNPIFIAYGILPLTIMNFVYMGFLLYGMKKSIKLSWIYGFVLATIFISFGHVLGAQSNIEATGKYNYNPEKVMEAINNTTDAERIDFYTNFVMTKLFIPFTLSFIGLLITYYLFDLRRPEREKYIDEGIDLIMKGKKL